MKDIFAYQDKKIHMIGIGGTSMSGIADILLNLGFSVTGSDMTQSPVTERLEKQGIPITIGHFPENVHGADVVVYTAAVKEDNPEMVEAKTLGLEMIERSDFLGMLTKAYAETIAISGTHGKTTTTSMIAAIFCEAGKDPSVQVGADLKFLGNQNYRVGKSPFFIVEACEYVRSFLSFFPKTEIVLNIEEDHLDYYKDIEDIKSAFYDFMNIPGKEGTILINADDERCQEVAAGHAAKVLTFAIQNQKADIVAENMQMNDAGGYSFIAVFHDSQAETVEKIAIELKIPGYHHIYNALAAILTAKLYGIANETIQQALSHFTGANRRFEYVGEANGASIYDDYAHHPTEIKATIQAANNIIGKREELTGRKGKLWVAFQPHTYTRTYALLEEFGKAFVGVDEVILLDIYAAREKDTGLISSRILSEKINSVSHNCTYLGSLEEAKDYLIGKLSAGDILLTVGAGTITKLGRMLTDND